MIEQIKSTMFIFKSMSYASVIWGLYAIQSSVSHSAEELVRFLFSDSTTLRMIFKAYVRKLVGMSEVTPEDWMIERMKSFTWMVLAFLNESAVFLWM